MRLLAYQPTLPQLLRAPVLALGVGQVNAQITQRRRRGLTLGERRDQPHLGVRVVERGQHLPLLHAPALFGEHLVDPPGNLGCDRGAPPWGDVPAGMQERRPPGLGRVHRRHLDQRRLLLEHEQARRYQQGTPQPGRDQAQPGEPSPPTPCVLVDLQARKIRTTGPVRRPSLAHLSSRLSWRQYATAFALPWSHGDLPRHVSSGRSGTC